MGKDFNKKLNKELFSGFHVAFLQQKLPQVIGGSFSFYLRIYSVHVYDAITFEWISCSAVFFMT